MWLAFNYTSAVLWNIHLWIVSKTETVKCNPIVKTLPCMTWLLPRGMDVGPSLQSADWYTLRVWIPCAHDNTACPAESHTCHKHVTYVTGWSIWPVTPWEGLLHRRALPQVRYPGLVVCMVQGTTLCHTIYISHKSNATCIIYKCYNKKYAEEL